MIKMNYRIIFIMCFISVITHAQTDKDRVQGLSRAAIELTAQKVRYDPTYYSIPYPNGDVPPIVGVCTDVVIRAYRKLGVDLQRLVHEDMKSHFSVYPNNWGLKGTDKNIDHRRVPNLATFFTRKGVVKPITQNAQDYVPGDIIVWRLSSGVPHIGIVVDKRASDNKRYLVVHNIGAGQVVEDCLFNFKITGHYAY